VILFFCQPEAVYACPLLDEAAAPAVHPAPQAGVPDVVGHQEEQDEGQQGGRQQLSNELHIEVKADAGLAAAASTAEVTLSDELVDDLQRLRELRLWLVDLDLVLVLEEVAAVLLDGLEGVLAVLDLVVQRVVEGDGRYVLDGELA